MKSFQKLITFFSSKYYNNLKFNNSMLSTTRIFFERTTKTSHSLQALGNVYRNSKWSDLNVFNVKEGSVKQFKRMFLLLISLFILVIFLVRFNYNWSVLYIFNLTEFVFYLKDILFYWVLFIFYLISFCLLKVTNSFSNLLYTNVVEFPVKLQDQRTITRGQAPSTNPMSKTLTTKGTNLDMEVLAMSFHLQKLVKHLHLVNWSELSFKDYTTSDANFIKLLSTLQPSKSLLPITLFFSSQYKFNIEQPKPLNFRDKEAQFYNCVTNSSKFNTHSLELNLHLLKALSFTHQKEFKEVISGNINLGKESKWLMKNSLLSHDLVSKTLSTTHVKKLYGSSELDSNINNKNIWASTKLNSNTNFLQKSYLSDTLTNSQLTGTLINSSNVVNLNNLEESFFWTVKRFKSFQTTNTYLQFDPQLNIEIPRLKQNHQQSSFLNKTNVFTYLSVLHNSQLSLYNLHFSNSLHTETGVMSLDKLVSTEGPEWFTLSNYDLNFSKLYFNNMTLQKNKLFVYSNFN